jgi:hypothetical protein
MPRVTDQKTRQFLLVTGELIDPAELPEKIEIYDVDGAALSIPRGGRRDIPITTESLAAAVDTGKLSTREAGGSESGFLDLGAHAGMLTHISVDKPCRVRLYITAAKRDADLARKRDVDPMDLGGLNAVPDHGCLSEFLLLTVLDLENVPADYLRTADLTNTLIYYRIGNYDLSAGAVTVTFTIKDMEG